MSSGVEQPAREAVGPISGVNGMELKRAGFYRTIFAAELSFPSLTSLVSESPQPDEPLIVQYFLSGRGLSACGGFVKYAFDPSKRILFCTTLTDGVWLWPSTFIYYVENYHCRVPIDFVAHMRSRGWYVDPQHCTLPGDRQT
ncbi:MAG TPA: hypothetical protein VF796_29575 [Humisphaera sp.]